MVLAYFGTRRGGSGVRSIRTAAEAEKILRGGYGVTNVRLLDGEVLVGARTKGVHEANRYFWWFDQDAFKSGHES